MLQRCFSYTEGNLPTELIWLLIEGGGIVNTVISFGILHIFKKSMKMLQFQYYQVSSP